MTYTISYQKNGVYQAIGMNAQNAEQATAYFAQYKPAAEFIGILTHGAQLEYMKRLAAISAAQRSVESREAVLRSNNKADDQDEWRYDHRCNQRN